MRPFRLPRRTLLRGAGSIALALPWLEVMQPLKTSQAAPLSEPKLVAVYTPGGTVMEAFKPIRTPGDFLLSPILAPLQPLKDRLVVLEGLDMRCAVGHQAHSGMVGLLTGCQEELAGAHPAGPSINQAVARARGVEALYLAVRWATGVWGHGEPYSGNVVSYRAIAGAYQLIKPQIDPAAIWQRLFGVSNVEGDFRRSMLDSVIGRFAKLKAVVGGRDRERLEQHMQLLRELELRVQASCTPPALVELPDYNPVAFDSLAPLTDAAIPAAGKLMMDMLVMALSCDLTSVATLQWADSDAGYTLPWLELAEVQNFYENNGGYRPDELTKIFVWYSQQHAYLLGEMAKVNRGSHSLLDESVVLFGSHLQHPATHSKLDLPLLLAGGGGGLVGDRYRTYAPRPHNDLLTALMGLLGHDVPSFGDPAYNTGPLTDLTS